MALVPYSRGERLQQVEGLLQAQALAGVVEGVDQDLGLVLVDGDVVGNLGDPDVAALVALADRHHIDDVGVRGLRRVDLVDHLLVGVVQGVVAGVVGLAGGDGGDPDRETGGERERERERERSRRGREPGRHDRERARRGAAVEARHGRRVPDPDGSRNRTFSQIPPLAAGAGEIEHRLDLPPARVPLRAPAPRVRIEQVGDELLFLVGQLDDGAHVGQLQAAPCHLSWHGRPGL